MTPRNESRRPKSTAAILLGIVLTPCGLLANVIFGLKFLSAHQSAQRFTLEPEWTPILVGSQLLLPAGVVALVVGIRHAAARRGPGAKSV